MKIEREKEVERERERGYKVRQAEFYKIGVSKRRISIFFNHVKLKIRVKWRYSKQLLGRISVNVI